MLPGYAVDKKFEVIKKDGTKRIYHILDHNIRELNSQALVDGTSYVCVYFPTEIEDQKDLKNSSVTNVEWQNQAFFIINKFDGIEELRKQIKNIDDIGLVKNFKINVLPTWYPRWPHRDFEEWKRQVEPTNPKELLDLLLHVFKKYIEFDDEATYVVVCLWVIGTYFYQLFSAYPYLDLVGTKRSGKTKTLELIKLTAFNSIMSPDLTGSSLFRLVEQTGATVLLDEAEHFKNKKSEQAQHVRTLLMQGFKKDQHAYRTNKDNLTVESFNLYSPKALGHINAFDDVLEDRCIQIVMKRSTNKDIQNTHPNESDLAFSKIKSLCYRLFLEYAKDIESWKNVADQSMPVSGRERELWLPLLTLARFYEGFGVEGVVKQVTNYATTTHKERQMVDEEENQDYRVMAFIASQISETYQWRSTTSLYDTLSSVITQYGINKEYFSMRSLSQTLKRLGFKKAHKENGTSWFITKETVQRAKERLGIDEEVSDVSDVSVQEQILIKKPADSSLADRSDVSVLEDEQEVSGSQNRHETDRTDRTDRSFVETEQENDIKTEPKLTELTHADTSQQKALAISIKQFKCLTCKAGPFFENEESKSVGNILEFHKKQGHTILWVKK